ncbi:MAG: Mur ligase family protein [Syntrophobacterales bacterium]|nr:Mur ligase family protein [Syntrophobacterales bacterium]
MGDGKTIYFMGIGGVAMGNMAGVCKELGYNVMGSDAGLYPPMSNLIEKLGIQVFTPYSEENIKKVMPDRVVIGNVIRATNPEARWVLGNRVPYLSITDLIEEVFLSRHKSLVVAGTHGKTTTTALLSWALYEAGFDPSSLVGGFVRKWGCGYRIGKGEWVVIEGDEYDTAFFDKTPKFWHYRPYGAIVTSVEFDHGDIYSSIEAIREAFKRFVSLIPREGFLVLRYEDPYREELVKVCKGKVISYGVEDSADLKLISILPREEKTLVIYRRRGERPTEFCIPLIGKHNALNALAVLGVLEELGISHREFSRLVENFPGVVRRQEIIGRWGKGMDEIILIDDFAHHPTAVWETLQAVITHYPRRRLIAVFEPRSNTSKRKFFQGIYDQSFMRADVVFLKAPPDYEAIPMHERIDIEAISEAIRRNDPSKEALAFFESEELIHYILKTIREGDVVVFMSNGAMDKVPWRVKEWLDRCYS